MLQGRVLADDSTPAGTFEATDNQTQLSACSPPNVSATFTACTTLRYTYLCSLQVSIS